jgi:hypothetical protein
MDQKNHLKEEKAQKIPKKHELRRGRSSPALCMGAWTPNAWVLYSALSIRPVYGRAPQRLLRPDPACLGPSSMCGPTFSPRRLVLSYLSSVCLGIGSVFGSIFNLQGLGTSRSSPMCLGLGSVPGSTFTLRDPLSPLVGSRCQAQAQHV